MTETATPPSPYALIGPARVAALVEVFYDRIEQDPAYARLRAAHGPDLAPVRRGFAGFLTGWLGGPRDWFASGPCVMSLHRPMAIDAALAEQWTGAMSAAIAAQQWDDPRLPEQLGDALSRMARAMTHRD